MKVAILGYGKMGHLIEKELLDRNHNIASIIDNESDWLSNISDFIDADIAIDFSIPETALANITRAIENNVPIVVGTTGWHNHLREVENLCKEKSGKLVYGANFSIGVNIFFKINKFLASLMNNKDDYSPSIEEIHHIHKKDAPSGTAIHLANDIIGEVDNLKQWQLTSNHETEIGNGILPIDAIRRDEVPGTHTIKWLSAVDDIEIKHTAHNRAGFAKGAVYAAEWLVSNPSGFYRFDEILRF